MGTDIIPAGDTQSLLADVAGRYGLAPRKFYETLKATVFRDVRSDEQFAALLVVARAYNLNPITKELYAFPDQKGGIVPVVGVDGWARIINEHPEFDGMEFRYAENVVRVEGGREAPEWVECLIYRHDRSRPVVVREYLQECFRPTGPWKSHTRRMLRHKAMTQCARIAFGFTGIYEPDEAARIIEGTAADVTYSAPRVVPALQPAASGEVIDAAQLQTLSAWCEAKGKTLAGLASWLESKGRFAGAIEDLPVELYEQIVGDWQPPQEETAEDDTDDVEFGSAAPLGPAPEEPLHPDDETFLAETATTDPADLANELKTQRERKPAGITDPQSRLLSVLWKDLIELGIDEEYLRNTMQAIAGKRSRKELTKTEAIKVIEKHKDLLAMTKAQLAESDKTTPA